MTLQLKNPRTAAFLGCVAASLTLVSGLQAQSDQEPFLPSPVQVVSTVPPNGDVNPYGVAFVPTGFPKGGTAHAGDILVSNFNNNQNLQGTGTTIIDISPKGAKTVFFQGTAPLGLSTALKVVKAGYVLVGNFPTFDGTCATAQAGSLLIIDKNGNLVFNWSDPLMVQGPWDMTVTDGGNNVQVYISNALTGTISRLDIQLVPVIQVNSTALIANGYMHRCDPAALVVAPTGSVYNAAIDTLYVASTEDNAVFAVPHASTATSPNGTGTILYQDNTHLHGPLGLAAAPNGDLLVANSDVINPDPNQPSEIVEFTLGGVFVKEISVDPNQGGSFGLRATGRPGSTTAKLAAADDNQSTLIIWTLPVD